MELSSLGYTYIAHMCMYYAIGIEHDKDKDILVHRYVVDIYVWKQMLDLHTRICETRQRISVHAYKRML